MSKKNEIRQANASIPTSEDFVNFKSEMHEEFKEFKGEIHQKFDDMKKDLSDKLDSYKEINDTKIRNSGKPIRVYASIIGLLLVSILLSIYGLSNKVNNTNNEQYYTKRVAQKAVLTVTLNSLKQDKINAIFKHDTCEERKVNAEIEACKKQIKDLGFMVIENTRGGYVVAE